MLARLWFDAITFGFGILFRLSWKFKNNFLKSIFGYLGNHRNRRIGKGQDCIIEVSLGDVESALEALKGGVNSIELCINLHDGGITPSIGLTEKCVAIARDYGVPVHVLVRPRPGDFTYSSEEFAVMVADIIAIRDVGAAGIVTGILSDERQIDKARIGIIRALAINMELTFHRAFDIVSNPLNALEDVIACGCDRLLTSGQGSSAIKSTDLLSALIQKSKNRITIIAAAGINAENVETLIQKSSVRGIHVATSVMSLKSTKNILENHSDTLDIAQMGSKVSRSGGSDTSEWYVVERSRVSELRMKAFGVWNSRL